MLLQQNNKRVLYCVAYEIRYGEDIQPGLEYLHARSREHARRLFVRGRHNKNFSIVGIAPAIGYLTEDDHGDKLVAD